MRDSMRLAALFGSIFCVAVAIPACGSDDEDEGTKKTGGTGGGVIGGTGGTGGSSASGGTTTGGGTGGSTTGGGTGGGTGGVASITCGTETCEGYNVVIVTIAPCCPTGIENKCGADVPAEISGLIGVPAGCYELEQEGAVDTDCPTINVNQGGINLDFEGCCNAATGMCGNLLDVSSFGGPNFGCASIALDGGTPAACDGASDGGTDGSAGSAGAAGDAGPADASTGG
jgi:hypothetical protein